MHWILDLDTRVFLFFHRADTASLHPLWLLLASKMVYLVPLILLWVWFARRRETSLLAFLAGLLAWQGFATIIGHFIPRLRPEDVYHFDLNKSEGLFHRPGSSFPSDHTSFMTALVVIFLLAGETQAAWVVIVLEILTVVSRVVVGFHWPGDILGGLVVGAVAAYIVWALRKPLERWVVNPLVSAAKKLHL